MGSRPSTACIDAFRAGRGENGCLHGIRRGICRQDIEHRIENRDPGNRLKPYEKYTDSENRGSEQQWEFALRPASKKDVFGYRLAIQAKPLNFLFSQWINNGAPFPARFAVARLRLISFLALEIEPSVIVGGVGGYSFLVGPAIMQTNEGLAANPVTISLKYHYIYFEGWGNENAFLIEITHPIITDHVLVGFGGGGGVGLNGVAVTEGNPFLQSRKKIVEANNGVFLSLVFDIGFCL